MGADIKSLRTRIKSVDSTLHLTKAMGLVASSKIRRANTAMMHSREYAGAIEETIRLLRACEECKKSPYIRTGQDKRVCLIVIAGDRGLAGGYNANVFRLAASQKDALIIPIGKRAFDRFGGTPFSCEHFSYDDANALSQRLCEELIHGQWDRLGILSTRYHNMMSQEPIIQWILPLEPAPQDSRSVLFEPEEMQILGTAVPLYVAGILIAAVRESFACEVAARRMAMDSASKNAQQMIDELQLEYNRARQSTITQEITEIVAGSGA